jgi:hypothetical protein
MDVMTDRKFLSEILPGFPLSALYELEQFQAHVWWRYGKLTVHAYYAYKAPPVVGISIRVDLPREYLPMSQAVESALQAFELKHKVAVVADYDNNCYQLAIEREKAQRAVEIEALIDDLKIEQSCRIRRLPRSKAVG